MYGIFDCFVLHFDCLLAFLPHRFPDDKPAHALRARFVRLSPASRSFARMRGARYRDGVTEDSPHIGYFWEVLQVLGLALSVS
jgi:hypothetical protein